METTYILVSTLVDQTNPLCFKDMAAWVLGDFKKNSHQSAIDVIIAAAK